MLSHACINQKSLVLYLFFDSLNQYSMQFANG